MNGRGIFGTAESWRLTERAAINKKQAVWPFCGWKHHKKRWKESEKKSMWKKKSESNLFNVESTSLENTQTLIR